MKDLSSAQIADLNRDHHAGLYFEGLIVTRDQKADPQVKDYFANLALRFSFEGAEYKPAYMEFSGIDKSINMEIPTNQIGIQNVGGPVESYLYDPTVHLAKNDIVVMIMHMDEAGVVSCPDAYRDRLQVQFVKAAAGLGAATIYAGLTMRLSDRIPRDTIENREYPGIPGNLPRAGV